MKPAPSPPNARSIVDADLSPASASAGAYAAFISYSHSDEKVAGWLHRRLETYRIPGDVAPGVGVKGFFGRRMGKVFRDRAEFAAGGELIKEIRAALHRSDHLIVLCSLKAAGSRYVDAEIEYFASLGKAGRIIPVIVEGDPPMCFPAALRSGPERLGADLRVDKDGRDAGSLKILAGLLGVGQDDLFRRERRRQRNNMLLLSGIAAAFAGIAVFAGIQTLSERRERLRAEDALAQLFVQRASDPTLRPAARARYALAGMQLFPDHARAMGLALGMTLQDQDRLLQTFENAGASAQFTSNGIVLRKADGSVTEWNTETGAPRRLLVASSKEVRDIVWREKPPGLAFAEADGALHLLDGANLLERWVQQTGVGMVWSIAFSLDGQWLGIAGEEGTAEVRDARTGETAFVLKPDRLALYKISFSNSGGFIATASHTGEAQIWSLKTGTLLHRLEGHSDRLRNMVFLGDGSRLATASMDGTIRLWNAVTGARIRTLEGHTNWVDALATDQDGKRLISGSSDGTAKLWDTGTGKLMATLPSFGGPVYGVAMSADGQHVAAGSADGTALMADVVNPAETLKLRAHEGGPVYRVAFSSDASRLITEGAVNTVRVWSRAAVSAAGEVPAGVLEHKTVQSKMDRGEIFVDNEGTVQVIDAKTRQIVRTLAGHKIKVNYVAVSKDGSLIATASLDNTAMIWKRSGGGPLAILRGHLFPLELVALSPDNRFAVTASRDETARLWDVASGRELLKWPTRTRWMNSLGFSNDGQMVLGEGEGRAFAWNISRLTWDATKAVQFACNRLLSPSQWSFTQDERQNDTLVREVWVPRRQNQSQAVCAP
jgi:WD40 repeat protein